MKALVTKLIGEVNDPNLKKFGIISIGITPGETYRIVIRKTENGNPIIARVVGDGYIAKSTADIGSSTSKELTYDTTGTAYVWYNASVSKIELVGKYSLELLQDDHDFELDIQQLDYAPIKKFDMVRCLGVFGDVSNFRHTQLEYFSVPYCPNLYGSLNSVDLSGITDIGIRSTPITLDLHEADLSSLKRLWVGEDAPSYPYTNTVTGGLSDLANSPDLEELRIIHSFGVTGNVADGLGALKKLKVLNLNGATGISLSSVEDFVSAQYTAGRTSVSNSDAIQIRYGGKLTFGDITLSASYNFLVWENATKIAIYYGASTIDNCPTMYVSGYSDAEISTNTDTGGVWEGKSVTKVN